LKRTRFSSRTVRRIVSRCYTNAPCGLFVHCLCQHTHACRRERRVDRLPRNRCSFGKLYSLAEFVPKVYGKWSRYDHQSQMPRFGVSADTSPSKPNVCSTFHRQMTTFHRLPTHLPVRQAGASLQVSDWFRLFFSQETSVGRLTPKVRWMPRMLERSE
jgi:hypothetical protein